MIMYYQRLMCSVNVLFLVIVKDFSSEIKEFTFCQGQYMAVCSFFPAHLW